MKNFWKGIAVGLGAVAPGLSGSILLVMFGLYENTITAISSLFKNFKKNIRFLIPLALGIGVGVILFSKLVNFLLDTVQMQTRFAFLGFLLGSVPLFFQEVRKKGFSKLNVLIAVFSFLTGMGLFLWNRHLFPDVTDPNLLQSVLLGLAVAASYIVPGVDSAAILSALGLYDLWVASLAGLDLRVLLPACGGAAVGITAMSFLLSRLISKQYTLTFSVIFGLFLSVIPSVLNESCAVGLNGKTAVSLLLCLAGFVVSLLFGRMQKKFQ